MKAKVSTGFDTWVNSGATAANYHGGKALRVQTGTKRALLHLEIPAPRGSVIVSATLRVYAKGASTGARTLTVERLASLWKAATVTWANQPAVLAGSTTAAVSTLSDEQGIAFDVTSMVQAMVDGSPNYGFRLSSNAASEHRFYSFDAGEKAPTLELVYQERPATPTNLRPGGRVAIGDPTLRWDYAGSEDQVSYQIQSSIPGTFSPADQDTGEIASSKAQHYYGWGFSGPTWWRVRVKDAGGQWSFWSDPVQMTRDELGTITWWSPSANPGVLWDATPPIIFELVGETLRAFELFVTPEGDRGKILHKSGMIEATGMVEYALPKKADRGGRLLVWGGTYEVGVRLYDSKLDRQGSADGTPPYVEAWRTFSLAENSGVVVPVIQSVEQDGKTPANLITWTCSGGDSFHVLRDGEELETGIQPGDTIVGANTYAWRDWAAIPGATHKYRVRAVVNGNQSVKSNEYLVAFSGKEVEGLWLIDPDTNRWFVLSGVNLNDWKHLEVGETYLPVGARAGIRITQALGGLSGSYEGLLRERDFRSVPDMERDFWRMKEAAPHSPDFRLVGDRLNIPVQTYDLSMRPSEESYPEYPRSVISFSFFQTGEFQFDAKV